MPQFDYLYEKYKRLMWVKAHDILRDHALAEDAVSEAFIRVYRHIDKIEDPDSSKTVAFLVTIVKNVAITLYHKRNKGTTTDISELEMPSDFNLEDRIAEKDEMQTAMQLIDRLSDELRAVFLLKYANDLSHKQIGDILGISENNVTVRMHRAKKKLTQWAKEVRQA